MMGIHGFSENLYLYPPKTHTRDQGYGFLRVRVRVWAEIPQGPLVITSSQQIPKDWQKDFQAASPCSGATVGRGKKRGVTKKKRCNIQCLAF